MRSLWNGSISFGLVNIPVKLYAATASEDIKFNYLHSICHTPIKYQKTCPRCAKAVTEDEIVKGYQFQKSQYVIMDEADFEAIAPEKTRSIDILDFVELDSIDPVYFQRTYFLEPTETGGKAYHLLKRAMKEKNKIAIAKVVIRSREYLAAVRVYGSGLALETMHYASEIRAIDQLTQVGAEPEINERELEMAMLIIDNLTTTFEPEKYRNEYREMLKTVIEQKVAGKEVAPAGPPPTAGKVIDLMAALEASVQATKDKTTQDQESTSGREPTQLTVRPKGRRPQKTEETG
ncbi:MAG: Ku protein [Firmicutes bacterium]|nr:Ku protein [Bacillota bacterium]